MKYLAAPIAVLLLCSACPSNPVGPTQVNTGKALCGNADRESSEVCDGADIGEHSCESLGFAAGALRCARDCKDFDRSHCGAPDTCNNGALDDNELCDGDELGDASCESRGYAAGTLRCLANCADFDTDACGAPLSCGNDRRDGVEVCDGNDFGGLSCHALGIGDGVLSCADDCRSYDTSACDEACTPTSCVIEQKNCGQIEDKCGAYLDCGTCQEPQSCGGDGVANVCGTGSCTATTCQAEGKNCGELFDGCESYLNCGSCESPETCGGGGVDGMCGCQAQSCQDLDRVCGQVDNGCGVTLNCGQCANGTCSAEGQCVNNCVPDCSQQDCGLDPVCQSSCGSCNDAECIDGACLPIGTLCEDYSDQERLNACNAEQPCATPFSCMGGIVADGFCADRRPCQNSPTASCCGQGEVCGVASLSIFNLGFCCRPGEALFSTSLGPATCVDGGFDLGCNQDSDCPTAWGISVCATWLDPKHCVQCRDDSTCSDDKPGCDTNSGACVECTNNNHCTSTELPYCDTTQHECVRCTSDAHCPAATPACVATHCVQCRDSSQCQDASAPVCSNGTCVGCSRDEDCPQIAPFCSGSNTCVPCPDFTNCTELSDGRTGCYPLLPLPFPFYQPCANDIECDTGLICGIPPDASESFSPYCVRTCQ